MAQKNINIGTPGGEDGDLVRDAFSKTEDNFTELFGKTNSSDFINDGSNAEDNKTYLEADITTATNGQTPVWNGTEFVMVTHSVNVVVDEVVNISDININEVNALHATSALTLPTYEGSGQTVHPSVIYIKKGFNGYKYWMVMTPYPGGNDDFENPSILVSNNRIDWEVPAGVANPIVPAPISPAYLADPNIIQGYDGKLYVYYREVPDGVPSKTQFKVVSSSDGITWSSPTLVIEDLTKNLVSPSVILDNGKYYMYYNDNTILSAKVLERIESFSPDSGWTLVGATSCVNNNMPSTKGIWHQEIRKYNEEYHQFYLLSDVNTNANNPVLYFGSSKDGVNFDISENILLDKTATGWASNHLYKATAVLLNNNKYAMWYGGVQGSVWKTGYTEVLLGGCCVNNVSNNVYDFSSGSTNPNTLYCTENKLYKGSLLIAGQSIPAVPYDLNNLAYNSKSFDLTAQMTLPISMYVKNDGTKAYILGYTNRVVYEYDFGTPYDISTLSLVNSVSVSAQTAKPTTMTFTDNGLKMYVYDNNLRELLEYTLSVAWDITTATFTQTTVGQITISSIGIYVKGDGTKIYVASPDTMVINEYTMSTPYDVTTIGVATTLNVASEIASLQGVWIDDSGTKLYCTGGLADLNVKRWTLSTPYDITTGSYDSEVLDLSGELSSTRIFVFANSGTNGFAVGDTSDKIFMYE